MTIDARPLHAPAIDGPALRAFLIARGTLRPVGAYTAAPPFIHEQATLRLVGPATVPARLGVLDPAPERAWRDPTMEWRS